MTTATLVPAGSGEALPVNLGLYSKRLINALLASRAYTAERMLRPHRAAIQEMSIRYGEKSPSLTPDELLPFKL
ncbi:hypothetical protein [Microvirga rosea]|uniref:hypothetical protein n=1 Tax=Microvirga rosea TaxID=2715425 RepID=UPI001D09D984|nr:hypothetical protein [Microvirga rosea]MCB8821336.1 hypothetical protein [Microvirga rosea]